MPSYEVEHICPLNESQRDEIAAAITQIHCNVFSATRLFVNVRFTDVSNHHTYVAGRKAKTNRILANIRWGPARKSSQSDDLCNGILTEWKKIVGSEGDKSLDTIFVLGSLIGGFERGFLKPQVGCDQEWAAQNLQAFKKLAEAGDQDFQELVDAIEGEHAFR
ncbi:hypothetical protein CONPUDRAFT_158259 [Coniophora puteana RWD-64-598 SS2]|uniref:Tautomerase cis-CaaD-like domain-containing protein n=1 Tax=Coniophora puteana (strain RWD-64-598) TaxID=741705 RepID=A0A5M3MAX8_CONPW|nr:uncharacterized protein CONPUDRAFT_158259 [Coniophora puteana RWD-64-598 SS2]EIW76233.1 hypothetical protein CONPUDRAFT_158259 [Coniophora puteana RWD-64-598 SS2]